MVKVENKYLTIHSLIDESESRKLPQITRISSLDCHTCACSFNANCLVRIMFFGQKSTESCQNGFICLYVVVIIDV